jgi:hypothetical protein
LVVGRSAAWARLAIAAAHRAIANLFTGSPCGNQSHPNARTVCDPPPAASKSTSALPTRTGPQKITGPQIVDEPLVVYIHIYRAIRRPAKA